MSIFVTNLLKLPCLGETLSYRHNFNVLRGKVETEFIDQSKDEIKPIECDAIIVTFDLTRKGSLQKILPEIQSLRQHKVPFIVVACKKDSVRKGFDFDYR